MDPATGTAEPEKYHILDARDATEATSGEVAVDLGASAAGQDNQSPQTRAASRSSSVPPSMAFVQPQSFPSYPPHHYGHGQQLFAPTDSMAVQHHPRIVGGQQGHSYQGTFNMANMQQALPVPAYPQQVPRPHPAAVHPAVRHSAQQSRFPGASSPAAVVYQLYQQIHNQHPPHIAPALTGAETGAYYAPTYPAPTMYYDRYGYHISPQDDGDGGAFQPAVTSSYGAQFPLAGTAPTQPNPQWYPPQQVTPYYYAGSPSGYHSGQLIPGMTATPVTAYHDGGPRRHSAPMRGLMGQKAAEVDARTGSDAIGYPQTGRASVGLDNENPQSISAPATPSLPRGPPRKPKQSGNSLWVGNLPVGTQVADLKDYFAQDAKEDIESVYLISKSNCAFVNYRTEATCNAAIKRFHDSRFQNTRLVCRSQRTTTPSPGTQQQRQRQQSGTGGSPRLSFDASALVSGDEETEQRRAVVDSSEEASSTTPLQSPPSGPASSRTRPRTYAKDRYFIVKSLTVEDLESSVRNGVWATQGHNESALNQAFDTADNVYLIFSANKSGEYYGYARMASKISDDNSAPELRTWVPSSPDEATTVVVPKATITPETGSAPRGCIYDDSARGTIFWEADPAPEGEVTEQEIGRPVPKVSGKPFKVDWISTTRVPFFRTRGMRNPWNSNREVKIARDGTELEENVGRRLVGMFNRNLAPQK